MDSLSLERFNHILQKPLTSLTADEISFLKARRDALNAMQKEFYSEILTDKKVETIKVEAEVTTEEPKKTVKKK